jgi:serine/threonine protein kinase
MHTLMPHVEHKGPGPHSNIVSVRMCQGVGEDYYIVMESCEGSLANLFAYGHHGGDWVLPVTRGLLTGLHFIHDLGALHNDLHCKNVLFVRNMKTRPGPFRNPVFFPLHGPGLFTFKIADFGQASSWFRSDDDDEHPELIVGDIRMAAHVLADVALGRHEGEREPAELERAAGKYAGPIQLAPEDGFTGAGAALAFLEALNGA